MKAAVVGGAGYVAGELLRILHGHPEVTEIVAVSRSQAGRAFGDVHPPLAGVAGTFRDAAPAEIARGCDAVFLAMEHGAAEKVAGEVLEADPGVVCDLSADFRVRDEALHARHYGARAAAARRIAARFVYALPDLDGYELRGARALAAPGCFATAAQLALAPLARLSPAGAPALFAVTGSSGGGAAPRATAHHPARAHNVFAYAPLAHRHEAEVAERWRAWTGREDAPRLMAHAGPFVRGIYLTAHARLEEPADAAGAYSGFYRGKRFVRVLATPPELTHVIGTNRADLFVATSDVGDEVQISIAIDNLVKGAAGQAVQAVNLALGLDESAGLSLGGPFPC